MKNIIITMLVIFLTGSVLSFEAKYNSQEYKLSKHNHNESSYQIVWCLAHNGIIEYENADKTRIDCLTESHAVEFDFANKWAESIGQALHYSYMTGKKGMVVLILENPETEMVYLNRVKCLGCLYNFDVEFVTENYLNLINGKCRNPKCKCHKKSKNIR